MSFLLNLLPLPLVFGPLKDGQIQGGFEGQGNRQRHSLGPEHLLSQLQHDVNFNQLIKLA